MAKSKTRLALHWKILIGLVLGVVVGLTVNVLWTEATWEALGVGDARSFLAGPKTAALSMEAGAPNEGAGLGAKAAKFVRNLNAFVGALFMNGLKFIAVPIVLFSLAAGVASLNDITKVGRIGAKTVAIYLVTTAVAITIGLSAANLINPGGGFDETLREELRAGGEAEA
ncbi:MAG: cation:dicarboxylate symporter family transporter, partial [Phycisphaerales bacterium JB041]